MLRRYRRRCLDRNKGSLLRQVFLCVRPNPFMDEVSVEVVSQGDIGNRAVRLRAFGNDLGLERLGVGTVFLWHGRPLKKAKNGVHSNWVDTIASSNGFRKVCSPDGYAAAANFSA